MENHEDTNQISRFNDGGLSISRLHDSWVLCKQYIRSGNLRLWKVELDNIWMELIPDVLRQDNKDVLLNKNDSLMKHISESKKRNKLFFALMGRHTFLRECQDIAGKAGVYIDADNEGFE